MKTSDWKRIIRETTREIASLDKEISKIKTMDKREWDKLGIKGSVNPYDSLSAFEEVSSSFPMYNMAADSRRNKLDELRERRNYLERLLLGIKCAALYNSKKINKGALEHGFVDNKAYADALIKNQGCSLNDVINPLNNYFSQACSEDLALTVALAVAISLLVEAFKLLIAVLRGSSGLSSTLGGTPLNCFSIVLFIVAVCWSIICAALSTFATSFFVTIASAIC
jgi:hypothetical protein